MIQYFTPFSLLCLLFLSAYSANNQEEAHPSLVPVHHTDQDGDTPGEEKQYPGSPQDETRMGRSPSSKQLFRILELLAAIHTMGHFTEPGPMCPYFTENGTFTFINPMDVNQPHTGVAEDPDDTQRIFDPSNNFSGAPRNSIDTGQDGNDKESQEEGVKKPWGPLSQAQFAGNNALAAHFPGLKVIDGDALDLQLSQLNLQVVRTEWQSQAEVDPTLSGESSKVFVIYVPQVTWAFLKAYKEGTPLQDFENPGAPIAASGSAPITYSSLVSYLEGLTFSDKDKPAEDKPYRVDIRLDEGIAEEA